MQKSGIIVSSSHFKKSSKNQKIEVTGRIKILFDVTFGM
jgi:hypothetical protein